MTCFFAHVVHFEIETTMRIIHNGRISNWTIPPPMLSITTSLQGQFSVGLRNKEVQNRAYASYKKWLSFTLISSRKWELDQDVSETSPIHALSTPLTP